MDDQIEQMIQAQTTTAPRITPADIENTIQGTYFVNAASAVGDAPILDALRLTTLCFLVLRNGFVVVGTSACVSPERFDPEIGAKLAKQKALDQIWQLEGYRLASELHAARVPDGT